MIAERRQVALYVHIPFCDRRCPYCHFYCFVNKDEALPLRYVKNLGRELSARTELVQPEISSVYFGGGTPSALTAAARDHLCRWMREELGPHLSPDAEITLEVNPESALPETLDSWVEAGVNRISVGIQSMDEGVLSFLGRLNTPASNHRALKLCCERVTNLSVDLILATPESPPGALESSLDLVYDYPITHVSAYLLEIHPETRFGREVAQGRWAPRPGEEQAASYLAAVEDLRVAGFEHYELSNFARAGKTSKHNQSYWAGTSYLGLGASAHSYDGARRWWNLADAGRWCETLERGGKPEAGSEVLDASQRRDEEILLGLRTSRGLDPHWLQGRRALWEAWIEAGYAEIAVGRPRLTPRGWLVMDEIARVLAQSEDPDSTHHEAST